MTDDRPPLAELLAKSGDEDFLRSLAESVLQIIMVGAERRDVEGVIGAGRHERSSDRTTWRNGSRDRTLETRLGPLSLKVPKLRTGSYFPGFLEPRKPVEKALVAVIQEAWIAGVSTRKVDDLVQAMGMSGISKSSVSKLCARHGSRTDGDPWLTIDERVGAFLGRTLEGEWPYLWLDATYLKVREGGRIVSVAAIVAVAVNTDGRREPKVRAQARDRGAAHRPLGGGDVLERVPQDAREARPEGHQAGDLRRPRGARGRHRAQPRRGHLAALPRALHEERSRPCPTQPDHRGRRRHPPGLRAARPRLGDANLAPRRRPAPRPVAQARRVRHGPRTDGGSMANWTTPRPTSWPTRPSPCATAPSCTPPTRSSA